MKKHNKFLVFILALAIILPVFTQVSIADETDRKVYRIAGDNRIQTAIKVSKESYDKAETVVISGFEGAADALTGTLLASETNAPMLLTYKDKLDPALMEELIRLETQEIYILGGEAVINLAVEQALEAEGYIVKRLAGETRVETAVKIAEEVFGENRPIEAFVVEYDSLVDALAIGPVAAMRQAPIFITNRNEVPNLTKDIITEMEIKSVTIVGGETKVTPKGKAALEALGASVNRVSGINRFKTSLEVANRYFESKDAVIVASGYSFADALVGGYFAENMNAPILLANVNTIEKDVFSYIKAVNIDTYVLGGKNVISQEVYNAIETLIELPEPEIPQPEPEPEPEPEVPVPDDGYDLPNRTLSYLEKGEDVKKVQLALRKLGYNVSIDSSYGPGTKAAVLAFQKLYRSLENTGIYGPSTRSLMVKDLKIIDSKVPVDPGDTGSGTKKIVTRGLVFNTGKASDQIRLLKDFFRARGETNLAKDYNYDNRTKEAVRSYQQLRGLATDGIAGPATLARINKEIVDMNYKIGLVTPSTNKSGEMIIINKSSNTLYFMRNGVVAESYPVATGKTPSLTPDGRFSIVVKFKNPYWGGAGLYPPIAGGAPSNPLGKRWIGISLKGGGTYGVHGNAAPNSIGTYASLGCVRMFNPDVESFYERVKINTPIWIGSERLLESYGVKFK